MHFDKRRQMILKAIPQRKRTSKKLKQKILEEIYFRSSSLPQKKQAESRQKESSFSRRHPDLKGQFYQPQKQRQSTLQVKQEQQQFHKAKEKYEFVRYQPIQRKNRSLPKYLLSQSKDYPNDSRADQSIQKNTDQYKTRAKKLSQKDDKQALNLSSQKSRLQVLQQILQKKNSQRLVRDTFMTSNMRNSPIQTNNQPQKPKHKDSKMIGMKYAFENRKFTNLSKYKTSMGERNNPFGSGKIEFQREVGSMSRKVSNQNSKGRIKTEKEEQFFQKDQAIQKQKQEIRDFNLSLCIDSEISAKGNHNEQKIQTLEEIFNQAFQLLTSYIKHQDRLADHRQAGISNTPNKKTLQKSIKLLKNIQKQTGSLSKKTTLLLGLANYHLEKFNDCIFGIENIFHQVDYDLFLIDSLKTLTNNNEKVIFFSGFFFVLAQSYKNTENFLCSIKVLDQWQSKIVYKILNSPLSQSKQLTQMQIKKRAISQLNIYQQFQNERKFINSKNRLSSQRQDDQPIPHIQNQLQPKKKSHSIFRQVSQDRIPHGYYFSSTIKEKQRTQSLIKKQSIKYKTQHINLKPRSKNLSIKTLSDINIHLLGKNSDRQNQVDYHEQKFDEEKLKNCSQEQRKVFVKGYLMRARIQFEVKNFYASIQDYQKTLKCQEDNLEAGLELATLYYKIGRKDKSLSFLESFLNRVSKENYLKNERKDDAIKQVKFHLAVMLYKCNKYQQSLKILNSFPKQSKSSQIVGQINFYLALNEIKIKAIFGTGSKNKSDQKQHSKSVEQVMIILQKSIDQGTSEFYIYAAYFLRIYLLLFKVKHYYGAQYQIDRLKEYSERKKYVSFVKDKNKSIEKSKESKKFDYRQVSIESFSHIINLSDLIQLASGIICILKLKLNKGLKIITQIEEKVKSARKMMLTSEIISIENNQQNAINQLENQNHINEILKLIYQFKYYGMFTMRQYKKAVKCLQRIRDIDSIEGISGKSGRQEEVQEGSYQTTIEHNETDQKHDFQVNHNLFENFTQDSDKLNYLTLKSLILIEQQKFHQALTLLKIVEEQSNGKRHKSHNKNHKRLGENAQNHYRSKSGNLDTISTVIEYKKDENMFHIIKALCYILLYKYLEDEKARNDQGGEASRSNEKIIGKQEIRLQHHLPPTNNHHPSSQPHHQTPTNEQILLVSQDLLSQCLICDKQNFQILYLIAIIHYELKRYESSLNYIRQAIELSDDHMIKHYYLKANMKLLQGKYQEAVKDYSNAVTVWRELEKEREQERKLGEQGTRGGCGEDENLYDLDRSDKNEGTYIQAYYERPSSTNNYTHSQIYTNRTTYSQQQNQNQYYEVQQQMHFQIYINRAIAYLKYAYSLQYEATVRERQMMRKHEDDREEGEQAERRVTYHQVRENVANFKAAAAQDVRQFFAEVMTMIKKASHVRSNEKQHKTIESEQSSHPSHPTLLQPSSNPHLRSITHQLTTTFSPYLQLLLHTSDVEPLLQISRTFAKQFNIKLVSDEELLVYFYIAKQLNNCLLLMEKIIKKHYLSERNKKELGKNCGKRQAGSVASRYEAQECEPYFKSKKGEQISRGRSNCNEFNTQKYTPKHLSTSNFAQSPHLSEHQRIQNLIFDKKVLSALKDSSNNSKEDYENALVALLEEDENIRKSSLMNGSQHEGGNIFKYSDLVFFIGVMYYMLDDFQSCVKYFEESYSIKKKRSELYSLKAVAVHRVSYSDELQENESEEEKWYGEKMELSYLKSFEEIYDNRIYSKEEIEYNIGVAYLMAEDYNAAYDHLEKYESFVEIIQAVLTQNDNANNLDDKKTKNKLKKMKKQLEKSEEEVSNDGQKDNSFDDISIKTKTNKDEQTEESLLDITPFPTHNRLCSIYPQKQINKKAFYLSFCLPKIELPSLGVFSTEQIQVAESYQPQSKKYQQELSNINQTKDPLFDFDNFEKKDKKLTSWSKKSGTKSEKNSNEFSSKFLIPKQNIINFLDIVSLQDIEMKPIAPWIKKDKEKRCIRFTDNFLSESFDLKTENTTERKHKNSSKKDMFGQGSSRVYKQKNQHQIEVERQSLSSKKKGKPTNILNEKKQKVTKNKPSKKPKAEQNEFMKHKQKQLQRQKPVHNRYQTIDHD